MRPDSVFDSKLQHERTALAWERTAIATIVAGTLLARSAAHVHVVIGAVGVAQVLLGAALLIWTGLRYEQLHAPLRRGESPVHPTATRIIGMTTMAFTGFATAVGVISALR